MVKHFHIRKYPPSMYQPIWDSLRTTQLCKVEVPNHLILRNIKAVTKLKLQDLGFKYMNEYERFVLRKQIDISPRQGYSFITFRLEATIGIEPIHR